MTMTKNVTISYATLPTAYCVNVKWLYSPLADISSVCLLCSMARSLTSFPHVLSADPP